MKAELLAALGVPFTTDSIKQRGGKGGQTYTYVPIGHVTRRVLDATKGAYSWEVVKLELVMLNSVMVWVCHGRLTIDGSAYDGIGTHPFFDEESPKAAESDSFKRAASKTGVALDLYDDPHSQNGNKPLNPPRTAPQPSNGGKPSGDVWEGPEGSLCPTCRAPVGKRHADKCAKVTA